MNEHPIRLVVGDDLERSRLTVLFRLLLAIPHYFWLVIWGLFALGMATFNWLATLVMGRSPGPVHEFLERYVRYATHLYAYLFIAANPYPGFVGNRGYPIDLEIDGPARQGRWAVAFRIVLAVPAYLFAGAVVGFFSFQRTRYGTGASTYGLLFTVGALGWFSSLARARMPRGLRDLAAYGLGYTAQLWGYVFLLTDRYPNSDPEAMLGELPPRHDPVRLLVTDDLRRSRLTVFFRFLLALVHLIWLVLWGLLAALASILNWLATLISGRPPAALHRFLSAYLRYQAHVYAFLYLIANPFPGFAGEVGSYPVEAVIQGPTRQNRWTVAFRALLAIPALAIASGLGALMAVAAFLGWFAALVRGEMPQGLRNVAALALRYTTQTGAYMLLVTGAYPYSGPCAEGKTVAETGPAPGPPATQSDPPASPIVAFG